MARFITVIPPGQVNEGANQIAVGSANIYWAGPSHIWRSNLDGTAPVAIVAVGSATCIRATSEYLYWTSALSPYIGRARPDGTSQEPQWLPTGHPSTGLSVGNPTYIFFANDSHVGRARKDGTEIEPEWLPIVGEPASVSANEEFVYWTNNVHPAIGRARLDRAEVEQAWVLLNGPVNGLVGTEDFLYWGSQEQSERGVGRVDKNGVQLEQRYLLYTPAVQPNSVATFGEYVWVADDTSNLIGKFNVKHDDAVFGNVATVYDVEKAVEATLKRWLPTYLAFVARHQGLESEAYPPIASWRAADTMEERFPEQQIPALQIMISTDSDISTHLAGAVIEYKGTIDCLVQSFEPEAARQNASAYAFAIGLCLAQNRNLDGSVLVEGFAWERLGVPAVARPEERWLALGSIEITLAIGQSFEKDAGPAEPSIPEPEVNPRVHTHKLTLEALD